MRDLSDKTYFGLARTFMGAFLFFHCTLCAYGSTRGSIWAWNYCHTRFLLVDGNMELDFSLSPSSERCNFWMVGSAYKFMCQKLEH